MESLKIFSFDRQWFERCTLSMSLRLAANGSLRARHGSMQAISQSGAMYLYDVGSSKHTLDIISLLLGLCG